MRIDSSEEKEEEEAVEMKIQHRLGLHLKYGRGTPTSGVYF